MDPETPRNPKPGLLDRIRFALERLVLRGLRYRLLLAASIVVTVAVLAAIVVDFAFQTRINVQIAANVRDRLKAYYLARSAMNFSRLILHFQGQVDRFTGGMIKLYQLLPVESDLAKALTVSTDELLGVKTPKSRPATSPALDPDTKRLWKRFQQVMVLPEKDRRAVIRLVNSLVAVRQQPGNGASAGR